MKSLKAATHKLRGGKPGSRFRELHESRASTRRTPLVRVALTVAGVLLVLVGIIELMVPGPGLLIIALGGALLARESRMVARFLDQLELRLRKGFRWAVAHWRRFRGWQKLAVVFLAAALLAGGLAAGYRVVTGW